MANALSLDGKDADSEFIKITAVKVASNGWKLIRNYGGQSLELYDVVGDIGETNNRAKDKPQLAKSLNDKLTAWLKETNAPMPRPPKN